MQVAHAGSYANLQQLGPTTSVTTDAGLALAGPTVAGVSSVSSGRTDPGGSALNTQTMSYSWTWTPNGLLANDPAPYWNAKLDFATGGGPIEAIITPTGGVSASARLYADVTTSTFGWGLSSNVVSSSQPLGVVPTALQSVIVWGSSASRYGNMQIVNNANNTATLDFTNVNGASSSCSLTAGYRGRAEAKFNVLSIRTARVTLQP